MPSANHPAAGASKHDTCDDPPVRRLRPLPLAELTDDEFRAAYGFPDVRPWVRGSMVSTLDGVMRGTDGTSRSIASAADRRVFSMLRWSADVILVGAGTIRDEDYRPSRLPIAIVTASLRLPLTLRLFSLRTPDTPRTLVLTTSAAISSAPAELLDIADVIACGESSVDLPTAVGVLDERGLSRIHCEGGPTLLGELAEVDLLDELLLTVTPVLQGGGADEHLLSVEGRLSMMRLEMAQVLEEDGSVFIRARRSAPRGGSS